MLSENRRDRSKLAPIRRVGLLALDRVLNTGAANAELKRGSLLIYAAGAGATINFRKTPHLPPRGSFANTKGSAMKYLSAVGFALTLLAGPSMAQSLGEKTGVNSVLGISPTTADFANEAALSDMFEIESSQIAQERGNASEKAFAATMIADHQKTTDELKSMLSAENIKIDLPAALDSSHQNKIDKLKSLNGADFSSRYESDQV